MGLTHDMIATEWIELFPDLLSRYIVLLIALINGLVWMKESQGASKVISLIRIPTS